jgi:hypothetical protein
VGAAVLLPFADCPTAEPEVTSDSMVASAALAVAPIIGMILDVAATLASKG